MRPSLRARWGARSFRRFAAVFVASAASLGWLLPAPAWAIFGGEPGEREPAVATSTVAIVVQDTSTAGPDGQPGYYPSTGIVVAPDWILTVRHAFAEHTGAQYVWEVRFARALDGAADGGRRIERADVFPHPVLDLALVHLDTAVPFQYRPVRLLADWRRLNPNAHPKALLAGFGPARNRAGRNWLSFVEEPISALVVGAGGRWPDNVVPRGQGGSYIEIDQRDGRGSCSGDSGGPAFAHLADGGLALLGVIKGNAAYNGTHPCLGYSYVVRVDLALPWLTLVTGRVYDPVSMMLVEVR